MSEKSGTPFKKVKLKYMPAVTRTPPKELIPVSSARLEEFDVEIRKKIQQNRAQFSQDDVVRSNEGNEID